MKNTKYDVIVLGGGSAGLVTAKLVSGLGKKVAIIEKAKLGGECTWSGCVPSKTIIKVASLLRDAQSAESFLHAANNREIDTAKIMAHIHDKQKEVYQTHTPEMLQKAGIDTYFGTPQFINATTIALDNQEFSAQKFILATGSQPAIPAIEGLHEVPFLTNETIFEVEKLPQSMIILGAGAIGIELACALHTIGVRITMLEKANSIMPKEDAELSSLLAQKMRADGIDIKTSITVSKVLKKSGITCVGTQADGAVVEFAAESILVALGRKPNLEGLNLEAIGIKTDAKGVVVNDRLQTTVKNIYACGDIVGPYQFSHMAAYQASIAGRNACIPFFKKRVDYTHVIWVTFSAPEFAVAGLTEAAARAKYGENIQVFRAPYASLDRAKIDDATFGMCKIICDKKGYILGAHILGARAGELIHEIQVGAYYNVRMWDFYAPIHAYPTYSELIGQLAKCAYISKLENNVLLRFIKKLFSK